jgi:hypothetical protein
MPCGSAPSPGESRAPPPLCVPFAPLFHGGHSREGLKVGYQAGSTLAQLPKEDGLAAALEQQQLIKLLQVGSGGGGKRRR